MRYNPNQSTVDYEYLTMMVMDGIGKRLKDCRNELGLNQAEFAKALGVTPGAISNLETGQSQTMSAHHVFAAAKILKVDPEWLATGKGDKLGEKPCLRSSLESQMLARQIDMLTPEDRAYLFSLIERLGQ